tara:strand:+ start:234 stop:995 length:762 start_codon:yes stop_codon:yes gene_type:complete
MMRKFSWMLLVLFAFSVYAEDEKLLVVESAKELKGVTAKKIIWKKDEAKMVQIPYVVKKYDRIGNPVLFFYMDTTEVTVGQFKKFLVQTDHPFDSDLWGEVYKCSPTEKHPMIEVSWHDAIAYAKWAGKRLPTGKEWELAARGGLKDQEYPWGDDESLARDYANYDGRGGKDKWDRSTAPVGSFKPNGYGLFDMAGNVWEWCQDGYDSHEDSRVLRGGGWLNHVGSLRVALRNVLGPNARITTYGFRCVSGSN